MAWSQDATSGRLDHAGTTREVYVIPADNANGPFTDDIRVTASQTDYEHLVMLVIASSEDGRNGFEVGITDTSGDLDTDLTIRKVVDGVAGTAIDTAAHGLTAAEPFSLSVEVVDGNINASVLQDGVAVASVTAPYDDFLENAAIGVVTEVDGAVVTRLEIERRRYQSVTTNETAVFVCQRALWALYENNSEPERIGTVPFDPDAQLSMSEYGGEAFIVGAGRAVRFDVLERTLEAWDPASGDLPGQTGPGTTSAFQVVRHGPRLTVLDAAERQATFSSIFDPDNPTTSGPDDFDTGLGIIVAGAAYSVGAGGNLRFGEDLIGALPTPDGTLLIACQFSMFAVIGDPVFGNVEQIPLTLDSGASNFAAMAPIDVTGRTAVHTPDGLIVVNNAVQGGYNLSAGQLKETLEFGRDERGDYRVQLIRDTRRGILWIFRTLESPDAGERSFHYAYFERTGGYENGQGGFFRQQFPEDFGPTAVCNWNGKVLICGRDGYVRTFGTADDDDDGTAIENYMPVSMMDMPGISSGVRMTYARVLCAKDSGEVQCRVYGGATPELAWSDADRRRLFTFSTSTSVNNLPQGTCICPVTDGAMVLELGTDDGSWWALEYVEANVESAGIIRPPVEMGVTAEPCRVTTATVTEDPWIPTDPPDTDGTDPGGGDPPDPPPPPPPPDETPHGSVPADS